MQFAKQFIEKGNHVIAAVRDPDASQGLKELKASHAKDLTLVSLDVADTSSISSWAAKMAESFSSVDVCPSPAQVHLHRPAQALLAHSPVSI